MTVIDTSIGIELLTLAAHEHGDEPSSAEASKGEEHAEEGMEEHEEEHEDEHGHEEGDDPHIWLSPRLVKTQAKHIYEALVAARPADEAYFTANYNQFLSDLDELDSKLKDAFAPIEGKTILVFHPAFGYLAHEYGFEQEAIEIEGKDPTPQQLQDIIDEARADDVKVIFVQQQFSTKSAEAIASEIGGAVVQIDPLAQDYFANLEEMSAVITKALE
jgi:zinc transport system substrate-binding protein